MTSVWTVVVAGGAGRRFGALKQFELLAGAPVVDHAVRAAMPVSSGVVLVVPPGTDRTQLPTVDAVVDGGPTRTESVSRGLAAVPGDPDVLVVHDGARPLATTALFRRVVDAVATGGADAAVPALLIADTVKRVSGNRVLETLDRAELVAVQTPQAFATAALRAAHARPGDATDDAALVEAGGGTVVWVEGEPSNRKITTPEDLVMAEWLLAGARR